MVDQYILEAKSYLPDFLHESDLMLQVMNCLDVLISTEQPMFTEIQQAYFDAMYRSKDYTKLSYDAKIAIVKELGFDYFLDITLLSSEQLSKLLIFFNLIYILKGTEAGLRICLDTLDMVYSYTTWDEMSPMGVPFTAKLHIVGNEYTHPEIFSKISNFVRSYMLPWVEITVELTIEAPPIYIYPNLGILSKLKTTKTFSATRDVVKLAIYDEEPAYDIKNYGAQIFNGPNQDNPYVYPSYKLTISTVPENATVIIDGVETHTAMLEQGKIYFYEVYQDDAVYTRKKGQIVVNADKHLKVKLRLK